MKFKIFVAIALTLIILLQGAIVGLLVFGGIKANQAASSVKSSVNDFTNSTNNNLDQVNKNLTKIGQELKSVPTIP